MEPDLAWAVLIDGPNPVRFRVEKTELSRAAIRQFV